MASERCFLEYLYDTHVNGWAVSVFKHNGKIILMIEDWQLRNPFIREYYGEKCLKRKAEPTTLSLDVFEGTAQRYQDILMKDAPLALRLATYELLGIDLESLTLSSTENPPKST